MLANLVKGYPVTPVVRAGRPEREAASGKGFGYHLGNLFHTIVVGSIADIKNLVVNRLYGSLQNGRDGPANVQSVNHGPPGSAVAVHLDLARRPGQPCKIVQHNVESHSGRGAVGRRVSQKGGAEVSAGH